MKSAENIIFSLVFLFFRFTKISEFLNFPSNKNVRKQHLSANAYFCVNMKFSYTIAGRKDEMSYSNETKGFFSSVSVNFSQTIFTLPFLIVGGEGEREGSNSVFSKKSP